MDRSLNAERPFIPGCYRGSPPANLAVETCELPGSQHCHFASVAADPLSARLTPSPHCSPVSSSALGSGSSAESRQRVEPQDSLVHGMLRPSVKVSLQDEWAFCRGFGLWPVTLEEIPMAPEPHWASSRLGTALCSQLDSPDFPSRLYRGRGQAGPDALNRPEPSANHGRFASGTSSSEDSLAPSHSLVRPWSTRWHMAKHDECRLQPVTDLGVSAVAVNEHQTFEARHLRDALLDRDSSHPHKATRSLTFQPMMAVAVPERRRRSLAAIQLKDRGSSKFSTQYHGMHTDKNASAEYLVPETNCALWLTNLPADVRYDELLDSINNIGRIYCSYINSPDNIKHRTAAAKVVFFSNEAAQNLLRQSWTEAIYIRGHRIKVSHNRIKYASNALSGKMSRVLIITGQDEFVNAESLQKWFQQRFVFQVNKITDLIKAKGRTVCEFRFGSYRCQAQMGKMSLEKDRPVGFKVEFVDDPCEFGDTMSSYGIADERIQGKGL